MSENVVNENYRYYTHMLVWSWTLSAAELHLYTQVCAVFSRRKATKSYLRDYRCTFPKHFTPFGRFAFLAAATSWKPFKNRHKPVLFTQRRMQTTVNIQFQCKAISCHISTLQHANLKAVTKQKTKTECPDHRTKCPDLRTKCPD
jgi:hypothetical protein